MRVWHCRRLDDSRADCTAGNNSAISIAMMPTDTKSSTSVTPRRSIVATTLLRNVPDQRLATHGPTTPQDDARETFASGGYVAFSDLYGP